MTDDPFKPRAVAPATGTAFDFIHIEVPCPQCHEKSKQRLAELVANDTTTCPYCEAVIDLTSHDWRTRLAEEADKFKQIKNLKL
jgi:hypothetical protein